MRLHEKVWAGKVVSGARGGVRLSDNRGIDSECRVLRRDVCEEMRWVTERRNREQT
jgi:hypothetical protein